MEVVRYADLGIRVRKWLTVNAVITKVDNLIAELGSCLCDEKLFAFDHSGEPGAWIPGANYREGLYKTCKLPVKVKETAAETYELTHTLGRPEHDDDHFWTTLVRLMRNKTSAKTSRAADEEITTNSRSKAFRQYWPRHSWMQ